MLHDTFTKDPWEGFIRKAIKNLEHIRRTTIAVIPAVDEIPPNRGRPVLPSIRTWFSTEEWERMNNQGRARTSMSSISPNIDLSRYTQ